jgi:hypothetical protein
MQENSETGFKNASIESRSIKRNKKDSRESKVLYKFIPLVQEPNGRKTSRFIKI